MSELGLIVSGASILGLSKAKKEYESAKAEYDRISKIADAAEAAQLADINQYNATKYDALEKFGTLDLDENGNPYDPNAPIEGVTVTPILGLYQYGQTTFPWYLDYLQIICFRFTNTSDRTVTIEAIYAKGFIHDESYFSFGESRVRSTTDVFKPFIIPPHSTADFIYGVNWIDHDIVYKVANFSVIVKFYEQDKKYFADLIKRLCRASLKAIDSKKDVNKLSFDEQVRLIKVGTIIKSDTNKAEPDKMLFRAGLDMIYHDSVDKNQRRALYEDIAGNIIWFGKFHGAAENEWIVPLVLSDLKDEIPE